MHNQTRHCTSDLYRSCRPPFVGTSTVASCSAGPSVSFWGWENSFQICSCEIRVHMNVDYVDCFHFHQSLR